MRRPFILRLIAVVILLSFLCQDIVWANPEILDKEIYSLQIPSFFQSRQQTADEKKLEATLHYLKQIIPISEFNYRIAPTIAGTRFDLDFSPIDESIGKNTGKRREGDNWIIPCSVNDKHYGYEAVIGPDSSIKLLRAGQQAATAIDIRQSVAGESPRQDDDEGRGRRASASGAAGESDKNKIWQPTRRDFIIQVSGILAGIEGALNRLSDLSGAPRSAESDLSGQRVFEIVPNFQKWIREREIDKLRFVSGDILVGNLVEDFKKHLSRTPPIPYPQVWFGDEIDDAFAELIAATVRRSRRSIDRARDKIDLISRKIIEFSGVGWEQRVEREFQELEGELEIKLRVWVGIKDKHREWLEIKGEFERIKALSPEQKREILLRGYGDCLQWAQGRLLSIREEVIALSKRWREVYQGYQLMRKEVKAAQVENAGDKGQSKQPPSDLTSKEAQGAAPFEPTPPEDRGIFKIKREAIPELSSRQSPQAMEMARAEYARQEREKIQRELEPLIRRIFGPGVRFASGRPGKGKTEPAALFGAAALSAKNPAVVGRKLLEGLVVRLSQDMSFPENMVLNYNQTYNYTDKYITREALCLNPRLVANINQWILGIFALEKEPQGKENDEYAGWMAVNMLKKAGVHSIRIEARPPHSVIRQARARALAKKLLEILLQELKKNPELQGIVSLLPGEVSHFLRGEPSAFGLKAGSPLAAEINQLLRRAFRFYRYPEREDAGYELRDLASQLREEGLWRVEIVEKGQGWHILHNRPASAACRLIEAIAKDRHFIGDVRLSDNYASELMGRHPSQTELGWNKRLVEGINECLKKACVREKPRDKDSDDYYWYKQGEVLRKRQITNIQIIKGIDKRSGKLMHISKTKDDRRGEAKGAGAEGKRTSASPSTSLGASTEQRRSASGAKAGKGGILFDMFGVTRNGENTNINDDDVLIASDRFRKASDRLSLTPQLLLRPLETSYSLPSSLRGGQTAMPRIINRIKIDTHIILIKAENFIKNSEASIAAKKMLAKFRHILNIPSRLPSVNSIIISLLTRSLPYKRRAVNVNESGKNRDSGHIFDDGPQDKNAGHSSRASTSGAEDKSEPEGKGEAAKAPQTVLSQKSDVSPLVLYIPTESQNTQSDTDERASTSPSTFRLGSGSMVSEAEPSTSSFDELRTNPEPAEGSLGASTEPFDKLRANAEPVEAEPRRSASGAAIAIVDSHDEAYKFLTRYRDAILINFDAHGDLGWIFVPENVEFYDKNDRLVVAKPGSKRPINEINWVTHAQNDGLIKKYVWVTPSWIRYSEGLSLEELPSFVKPVIITIDYDYFALYDIDEDAGHIPKDTNEIKREVKRLIDVLKEKKIYCEAVILSRSPGYAVREYVKDIEKELVSAFRIYFRWQEKDKEVKRKAAESRRQDDDKGRGKRASTSGAEDKSEPEGKGEAAKVQPQGESGMPPKGPSRSVLAKAQEIVEHKLRQLYGNQGGIDYEHCATIGVEEAVMSFDTTKAKGNPELAWLTDKGYKAAIDTVRKQLRTRRVSKRRRLFFQQFSRIEDDSRKFGSFEDLIIDKSVKREEEVRQAADLFNKKIRPLLSPAAELILRLYYFEGRTQREIGEILHKTQGAISIIMRRVMERLRQGKYASIDFALNNSLVFPGFGRRIKEVRNGLSMAQEKAAKMIGVRNETLSHWETEKVLPKSYNAIATFAAISGVPLEYFLKGEKAESALSTAGDEIRDGPFGTTPPPTGPDSASRASASGGAGDKSEPEGKDEAAKAPQTVLSQKSDVSPLVLKEDDYIIGRTLKAAYEAHQKDPTGGIVRPVGPKIITKVLTILSKIAKLDCPIAAKIKEKLEELRKAGGRINIVNYPNLTRSCVSGFGISIAYHLDMTDKNIENELLHQTITGCIFGDKHKVHELADTVAEAVSQKRFKDAADIVLSRVNIGIWVPELKAFPHLFSLSHFKLYRWVYAYLALTIISAISAYRFLSANNLLLAFLSAILLIVSWNIGCRTFIEIHRASTISFLRHLKYLYSPQIERNLFLLNEDRKALWEITKEEDILGGQEDVTPPPAGPDSASRTSASGTAPEDADSVSPDRMAPFSPFSEQIQISRSGPYQRRANVFKSAQRLIKKKPRDEKYVSVGEVAKEFRAQVSRRTIGRDLKELTNVNLLDAEKRNGIWVYSLTREAFSLTRQNTTKVAAYLRRIAENTRSTLKLFADVVGKDPKDPGGVWMRAHFRMLLVIHEDFAAALAFAREVAKFLDYRGPYEGQIQYAGRLFFEEDVPGEFFFQPQTPKQVTKSKAKWYALLRHEQWLLNQIAQAPLLTPLGEVFLCMRARFDKEDIEKEEEAAKDERAEEKVFRLAINKDANETVCRSNLKWVVSIAKRYTSPSFPLSHLVNVGSIGLMQAAPNFEPQLGFKFSTYATWWIRQAILREIGDFRRQIRTPSFQLDADRKLIELCRAHGVEPTDPKTNDEIIMEISGIPLEEVTAFRRRILPILSLDKPYASQESEEDYIFSDTLGEQDEALNLRTVQIIAERILTRTEEAVRREWQGSEELERNLLIYRWRVANPILVAVGTETEEPIECLTLEQAAKRLYELGYRGEDKDKPLSRERVRQIEVKIKGFLGVIAPRILIEAGLGARHPILRVLFDAPQGEGEIEKPHPASAKQNDSTPTVPHGTAFDGGGLNCDEQPEPVPEAKPTSDQVHASASPSTSLGASAEQRRSASGAEPVELVIEVGEKFKQEFRPLLEVAKQMLNVLSPQKPISSEMKIKIEALDSQFEQIAQKLFAMIRDLRGEAKKASGNKGILLEALANSIIHYIGNTLNGASPALYVSIKNNELTQEAIDYINSCLTRTDKIIEGIISTKEVRLSDSSWANLYISGMDDIEGFPNLMVSFESEIQSSPFFLQPHPKAEGAEDEDRASASGDAGEESASSATPSKWIDVFMLRPDQIITLGNKNYKVIPRDFSHGGQDTKLIEELDTGRRFVIKPRRNRWREEKACELLSHPCHAQLYAVYKEEDVYLMPDYGTLTLEEHIRNSARIDITLREWLGARVNEIIWLYEALDEMHTKGASHNDLKPSHIMYSNGLPHLTDYHTTSFDSSYDFNKGSQAMDTVCIAGVARNILFFAKIRYGNSEDDIDKLDKEIGRITSEFKATFALSAAEAIEILSNYLKSIGVKRMSVPPHDVVIPKGDTPQDATSPENPTPGIGEGKDSRASASGEMAPFSPFSEQIQISRSGPYQRRANVFKSAQRLIKKKPRDEKYVSVGEVAKEFRAQVSRRTIGRDLKELTNVNLLDAEKRNGIWVYSLTREAFSLTRQNTTKVAAYLRRIAENTRSTLKLFADVVDKDPKDPGGLWMRAHFRMLLVIHEDFAAALAFAREVAKFLDYRGPYEGQIQYAGRLFFEEDVSQEFFFQPQTPKQATKSKAKWSALLRHEQWLLNQIAQAPLLTPLGEVFLCMRARFDKEDIEKEEEAAKDGRAEEKVFRLAINKDANETVCRSNLKWVVSIAKRYTRPNFPLSHLVNVGSIGLMQAAPNFEPQLGFKFSTYATWWIRQAILREIGGFRREIRTPSFQLDTDKKLIELCRAQGVEPTDPKTHDETIMKITGKSFEEVTEFRRRILPILSLDKPYASQKSEEDYIFGDTLGEQDEAVDLRTVHIIAERILTRTEEAVRREWQGSEELERNLLIYRWRVANPILVAVGTETEEAIECLTLEKTAKRLYELGYRGKDRDEPLSRERVRQIEEKMKGFLGVIAPRILIEAGLGARHPVLRLLYASSPAGRNFDEMQGEGEPEKPHPASAKQDDSTPTVPHGTADQDHASASPSTSLGASTEPRRSASGAEEIEGPTPGVPLEGPSAEELKLLRKEMVRGILQNSEGWIKKGLMRLTEEDELEYIRTHFKPKDITGPEIYRRAYQAKIAEFKRKYENQYPILCKYIQYYWEKIVIRNSYPENGLEVIWFRVMRGHKLHPFTEETIDAFDEALPLYNKYKTLPEADTGVSHYDFWMEFGGIPLTYINKLETIHAAAAKLKVILEKVEKGGSQGQDSRQSASGGDDAERLEPSPLPLQKVEPYLRDFRDPRLLTQNLIEALISILFTGKKLTLAFHKDIQGFESKKLKPLLRQLSELKGKKEFEPLLKNLVIIQSFTTSEELSSALSERGIDPDDRENNPIFVFAPAERQDDLSNLAPEINRVLINEGRNFNSLIYYYPLIEIVTITLVKYHKAYTEDELRSIIEHLNIRPDEVNIQDIKEDSGAFLIFALIPKVERINPSQRVERYALIHKFIDIAA